MRAGEKLIAGCLAFCSGAITALFGCTIPVSIIFLPATLAAGLLVAVRAPKIRLALLLAAGFFWANYSVSENLAAQLSPELAGTEITLIGRIASIPDLDDGNAGFLFAVQNAAEGIPDLLRLRWYRDAPVLNANEVWKLRIRVLPPRGRVNFSGFDYEKWLFARSIGALGTVREGQYLATLQSPDSLLLGIRQNIASRIEQHLIGHSSQGLIKALSVGDRTGISDQQWKILAASGTTHLLAISGMHIGMIALFGFWAGKMIWRAAPISVTAAGAQRFGIAAAICFAGFYALLSGFVVPAQRALLLLIVVLSGQLVRCRSGTFSGLILALTAIVLLDPLTPLRIGFWLSFSAVAVLLYSAWGRQLADSRWRQLLRAQWVVIVGMTPLTIFWFQQASMMSIPANLVAIPLISLLVMPMIFTSILLLPMAPVIAGFLLWVAAETLSGFQGLLELVAMVPGVVQKTAAPGLALTLAGLAGVLLLLAPRAIPGRYCGIVLLLPVLFGNAAVPAIGSVELTLLDVGQGSAALLRTSRHLLLYDTGPGDGADRHLVDSTIVPAIQNTGLSAPDTIIVSHADLDHAGGLARLSELYPSIEWVTSLPATRAIAQARDCRTPFSWQQDGFTFTLLHPGPGLPYLGNDSSCVLSVTGYGVSLLLPGDISQVVEQRLIREPQFSVADLLAVPHHGSASSSSGEFVQAAKPRLALISSGYLNQFGLPKEGIIERYRRIGARVMSTAECGAIRATLTKDGRIETVSARRSRAAVWRQQAADSC